ncbi:type II toxin-antitoxin system RelE/ParE family toxin [Mycobacterium sp. M1]|uniref:Type II toxin-antitoxin system RelE/ParE family toxin n=1 Tax=Mycolicibacter acidiphilus TaxID=2835306 RepID=A0ABS5RHG2_9MYCO|nr:type II toxin-antitoxin system RelE/ParE family toxin [Mycolicibacter acidiphilus]MBS9532896.1 type II toxin-antitoxin system RelE/ParE family toxin [Mycolicibacter acidiphilus]
MSYRVRRTRGVERAIDSIEKRDRLRIEAVIALLAENPRPPKALKMTGYRNRWRVRAGDYRILYEINDDVLTVLVIRVAHRREVYRDP